MVALDDDGIDRRVKNGAKDLGDIRGVKVWGQRLVIECKDELNGKVLKLPGWIREAHIEAGNDDALCGVVIHKRTGTRNPLEQWCSMTVGDLVALITGIPQPGRYE